MLTREGDPRMVVEHPVHSVRPLPRPFAVKLEIKYLDIELLDVERYSASNLS